MNKISSEENAVINLQSALQQCQESARRGYKIASDNIKETAKAITIVSKSLSACLKIHDEGAVRTPEIVEQLKRQFVSVVSELEQLQNKTEKDLQERKIRLDRFSITLFGRTMAGKSTLMEILTHGDGKSIGLGAQRTTRDVRSYTWNGLEVTDVPGVAAFEGEEDEELAFHSAAQADLVIFLITDDAPQPIEAECFAQVRRLGKPIVGICNVKTAVDEPDDLLLFLRNSNRPFEQNRLSEIIQQFNAFADRLIPGKRIQFISTHLRSRFLAGKHQYSEYEAKLIEASRFNVVEQRIISEVSGRGSFLRIKSFIDGAVAPILELTDTLLDFSAQNSASGRVLIGKHRQLNEWAKIFKSDGLNRIDTLIAKLMDSLRQDVSDFAEEHYEDGHVGEKWNRHVQSTGINEKSEKLLTHLSEDCKKAMQEIARELKSELSKVADFSADKSIKMDGVFDAKKWWNRGTVALSAGLVLAAIIYGSTPIGWAAAAVSVLGWLGSFLFDERENKADKAREKLSKKLNEDIDKIERNRKRQLSDWFFNELIKKQVDVLLSDIRTIESALFELADAQRALAWTLNKRIRHLTKLLIKEGLKQVNASGMEYHLRSVARVPGCANMLLIAPEIKFPEKIKLDLERLLGESVWFVIDNGNPKSILSQAIGRRCDRNKISIESKLKIAHIPLDELDALTLTRVNLAQQLTELHITK
ncbi:GTPase domain-containing protein [Ferrovum myxofaciens]|uniref:GTPase domain-containing protein n=1 Tax=Ferrovum myxofaciens TaxID=416213 RepID=UPI0006925635|nr:GTPase domain-containing protein [Ferrovum myxofaciens]